MDLGPLERDGQPREQHESFQDERYGDQYQAVRQRQGQEDERGHRRRADQYAPATAASRGDRRQNRGPDHAADRDEGAGLLYRPMPRPSCRIGLPAEAGRCAALLDLCTQMPPAVLQRLLGISPMAAERWSAGAVRMAYAAEVARRS